MLTITDTTFCGICPEQSSNALIREFYHGLLALGVDVIEVTPEILSILGTECDLSKAVLSHATREVPIDTAWELFAAENRRLQAAEELYFKDYRKIFSDLLTLPFSLSFCAKDAGFTATALTVEWVLAGGQSLACSFMGTGGYAPLEEVVLALQINGYPLPQIDTALLKPLGILWQKLTGCTIPAYKPILGEKVFEVESGIHINGILKNNLNYEPFSPERVGAERRFSLGKFSGKSALGVKLAELKILDKMKEPDRLLRLVREKCLKERRGLSDRELFLLLNEMNEGTGA